MPPQEGEQVTRARCAECGAVLATELVTAPDMRSTALLVHPCGACLQEAREDAIAGFQANREPLIDESRD